MDACIHVLFQLSWSPIAISEQQLCFLVCLFLGVVKTNQCGKKEEGKQNIHSAANIRLIRLRAQYQGQPNKERQEVEAKIPIVAQEVEQKISEITNDIEEIKGKITERGGIRKFAREVRLTTTFIYEGLQGDKKKLQTILKKIK
jgi:hypothetical protein